MHKESSFQQTWETWSHEGIVFTTYWRKLVVFMTSYTKCICVSVNFLMIRSCCYIKYFDEILKHVLYVYFVGENPKCLFWAVKWQHSRGWCCESFFLVLLRVLLCARYLRLIFRIYEITLFICLFNVFVYRLFVCFFI